MRREESSRRQWQSVSRTNELRHVTSNPSETNRALCTTNSKQYHGKKSEPRTDLLLDPNVKGAFLVAILVNLVDRGVLLTMVLCCVGRPLIIQTLHRSSRMSGNLHSLLAIVGPSLSDHVFGAVFSALVCEICGRRQANKGHLSSLG